jgi:hypothetical protein
MKDTSNIQPVQFFPVYLKHINREDYYKIESLLKGHFIRNIQTADGGYCFQSNNVKETEIALVLKADSSELINAEKFKSALKDQVERNARILDKLAKE